MNDLTIINYLTYLKEVSHKIGFSLGLENLFYKKKNKKSTSDVYQINLIHQNNKEIYINKQHNYYQALASLYNQKEKDVDKKIYVSFGLVLGQKSKKVMGPLTFMELDLVKTEIGDLIFSYSFENMHVNYDLMSSIVPDNFELENDFRNNELLDHMFSLDQKLKSVVSYSQLPALFIDLINNINPYLQSKTIDPYDKEYNYLNEISLKDNPTFKSNKLFFISDIQHVFIATTPSQISTHKCLNDLCEELNVDKNFSNPVLQKILLNVFNKEGLEEEENFNPELKKDIEHAINTQLHLDVSDKQASALKNAFLEPISYIQGPPGTGKSYTISAIVAMSVLLGKKVLVVSQKKPALEVVRDKIKDFFDEKLISPFIYFNQEEKKELKGNIKKIEQIKQHSNIERELVETQNKLVEKEQRLTFLISEINSFKYEIKKILDKNQNYVKENNLFIEKRKAFFENDIYQYDNKTFKSLNTMNEQFLLPISKIENKYANSHKLNQYDLTILNKLNHLFNQKFEKEINLIQLVKKNLATVFLKDWFLMNVQFKKTEEVRKILPSEEITRNYRLKIKQHSDWKKELQKEIFQLKHKEQFLKALQKTKHDLDEFSKMLHFANGERVMKKMEKVNYNKMLDLFPVWLSEIRNIGEVLPSQSQMFDLVVVDEASQVNLAEIIPVFYRGKNICIVGDHKQLGLSSVGLNFQISKKFDKLVWEKFKANNLSFDEAKDRNLNMTNASILSLIQSQHNFISFKEVMLDEHFRSLPRLAMFNNESYYAGELKIMTQTAEKTLLSSFSAIKVEGQKIAKTVQEEAQEIINILKYLTGSLVDKNLIKKYKKQIELNPFIPESKTIGIVSFIREQVNLIKELIDESFSEEITQKYQFIVGTPEELQGNERDIMIISACSDNTTKDWGGFYSKAERFNVATSRAKFYTIFVYAGIQNIASYNKYLRHFNIDTQNHNFLPNETDWTYDESKYDSEFERHVAQYLISYMDDKNQIGENLSIYNQVSSCGEKRLDFVLFNNKNRKSVAIEVDGAYHFNSGTKEYSQAHLDRMYILQKAGWSIINTPYYLWYKSGWLSKIDEDNVVFQKELNRIYEELDKQLF